MKWNPLVLNTSDLWCLVWCLLTGPGFKLTSLDKINAIFKYRWWFLLFFTLLLFTYSKRSEICTAWKVSQYGPENSPYLDTFHTVAFRKNLLILLMICNVYIVKCLFLGQILRLLINLILLRETSSADIAILNYIKVQSIKISDFE